MRTRALIPLLVSIAIDVIYAIEQQPSCQQNECLYKGQCHKKGRINSWEEVDEENGVKLQLFCTYHAGANSKLRIKSAECEYNGVHVKNTDGWMTFAEPHCTKVRCYIRRGTVWSVHKIIKYTGCPYNGECYDNQEKWNETVNSFIITNKCRLSDWSRKARIRPVDAYCPKDGDYIRRGGKWDDADSCVKYRCAFMWKQTKVKLYARKYGCPVDGECKPRGSWNDTSNANFVYTYRCRFNRTHSRTAAVTAYCRTSDDTYVGNGQQWKDIQQCSKKTCSFNKQTMTISVPAESLGCNVQGHGCIENGETGQVNINGQMYNVLCNNNQPEVIK